MSTPLLTGARFIGQRLPRKEDARLLTGRGTFVDDVILPGMLHAAFVRSPIARGRIRSIDTAEALAQTGVRAIYTAQDFEPLGINLLSGRRGSREFPANCPRTGSRHTETSRPPTAPTSTQ